MKLRRLSVLTYISQRLKQLPLPLYALLCLLLVAVIFYASYGFSNTVAANRADMPEIYFAWERQLPFWAWSIIPYWSLNVFYALAFFLCQSRQVLHHYVKQLLLAQAIAVICFLLLPLQFSWEKPLTDGLSGYLFASLASFDQPYNQAPSLHIILVLLVGQFYYYRLPRFLRPICVLWFTLVAVSVLTTYQHHFIDIPSGILVGALILWYLPYQAVDAPRVAGKITAPQRCLFNYPVWALFYAVLAVVAAGLAVYLGATMAICYVLLWPAISCFLVSAAYAKLGVSVFQKQRHGRLSFAATLLLLPYLLGVRLNIAYWLRGKAKIHRITPTLYVGSILQARSFSAVVDVCAEYPINAYPLSFSGYYQRVSLLDMVAPDEQALKIAATAINEALQLGHQSVYVCCALGYGRSVAVVLTWLLRYGGIQHIEDAIAIIRQAHPNMVLSNATQQAVVAAAQA